MYWNTFQFDPSRQIKKIYPMETFAETLGLERELIQMGWKQNGCPCSGCRRKGLESRHQRRHAA
jgi:hypothetical protein